MFRPGDLKPGTVLGGCRIETLLGRGGMAVVYRATQLSLGRPVALKVLPTALASDRQFVERFNREASALARLSHPNIVGILDKGVEGETYYFVMEYVEGKSLRDRLLREGNLPPEEARRLMEGICAGLEYAHKHGIVHRDLKPGNILLDASGTPKLADFGIARIIGQDTSRQPQLTSEHMVMGSAEYMAPEQRQSAAAVDHRSDIYALGVILYQMLTGKLPVGTFRPVSHLVPGLSSAVDRVVRKALAPEPSDRFGSVAEFRAALSHAFAQSTARPARRAAVRRRKSTSAAPVAAAVAVAGVAIVVLILALTSRSTRRPMPAPTPHPRTANAVVERPPVKPTTPQPTRPATTERPTESAAVQVALAEVRNYILAHPDDYQGQIERLKNIIVNSREEVATAARAELRRVTEALEAAIADHFARQRKKAEELLAERRFSEALAELAKLPANLRTKNALAKKAELVEKCQIRIKEYFDQDKQRAEALIAEGKLEEAAATLQGQDYGVDFLNEQADAERRRIAGLIAAREKNLEARRNRLQKAVTERLLALWAERSYPEALAAINDALGEFPDEKFRQRLAPHLRAAKLLDFFWRCVLDGARDCVGERIKVNRVRYKLARLEGAELVLALPVGEIKRDIRKLTPQHLFDFAVRRLRFTRTDDCLALALFYTYDAQPNPEGADKAFQKAAERGADPKLIAALRDLRKTTQTTKDKPPQPTTPGLALDLNGASDYLAVPQRPKNRSLNLRTFTIEAWVWRRPSKAKELTVIARNAGWTSSCSFAIYVVDGKWAYATGNDVEADRSVTRLDCPVGRWVHCALAFDGKQRLFFLDGKLVHRSPTRCRLSYDDKPLWVGARQVDARPGAFWTGGIDEVRITNGVRYREDFTPERNLKPDALTHLLLTFDDEKPPAVRDHSRFKNHGQLHGGRLLPPDTFKLPPPPKPRS